MTEAFTGTIGTQQFLNLFVAQLKNQDPLSPLDQAASLSQLAQFSQLESSQQMNENFQKLLDLQLQANSTQVAAAGAGFLGREVTYGNAARGIVDSVHYEEGKVTVQIGDLLIPIETISSISLPQK